MTIGWMLEATFRRLLEAIARFRTSWIRRAPPEPRRHGGGGRACWLWIASRVVRDGGRPIWVSAACRSPIRRERSADAAGPVESPPLPCRGSTAGQSASLIIPSAEGGDQYYRIEVTY